MWDHWSLQTLLKNSQISGELRCLQISKPVLIKMATHILGTLYPLHAIPPPPKGRFVSYANILSWCLFIQCFLSMKENHGLLDSGQVYKSTTEIVAIFKGFVFYIIQSCNLQSPARQQSRAGDLILLSCNWITHLIDSKFFPCFDLPPVLNNFAHQPLTTQQCWTPA